MKEVYKKSMPWSTKDDNKSRMHFTTWSSRNRISRMSLRQKSHLDRNRGTERIIMTETLRQTSCSLGRNEKQLPTLLLSGVLLILTSSYLGGQIKSTRMSAEGAL